MAIPLNSALRTVSSNSTSAGTQARAGWLLPLIVGGVIRACYILYAEGDPGDGVTRTLTANAWLTHGGPLFGAYIWPELNYLLPALAIRITGELYWGVRFFYMLLALSVIPLGYKIAEKLQDRSGARLVAWTLALLPYHIVLSTDGARGEPLFVAGAMLGVVGAMHWAKNDFAPRWALVAATGALIAQGLRFDGVILAGGLGLAMLLATLSRDAVEYRKRAVLGLALFATATVGYPLALSLTWNSRFGDPLHVLHIAQYDARQFMRDGEHPRWPMWFYRASVMLFWPLGALYAATPIVGLIAALGLLGKSDQRKFLMIPLILYTTFCIYSTLSLTSQPQLRYAAIIGFLLVPFLGLGLKRINGVVSRPVLLVLAIVGAGFVQIVASVATLSERGILTRHLIGTALVQRSPYAAADALQAATNNSKPGATVIIETFVNSSYAALADQFRKSDLRIEWANIYHNGIVMTEREYMDMLRARLERATFVMVDVSGRMRGFVDGLRPDPVGSQIGATTTRLSWGGHDLVVVHRAGSVALLKRTEPSLQK